MGRGGSVLGDDPHALSWSRVASNVMYFGIGTGIATGLCMRISFLVSRTSRFSSILNRLPPNQSAGVFGAIGGIVGGIYGFDREMVGLIQPGRLYVPDCVDTILNPIYLRNDITPRAAVAYDVITKDILQHEVGIGDWKRRILLTLYWIGLAWIDERR